MNGGAAPRNGKDPKHEITSDGKTHILTCFGLFPFFALPCFPFALALTAYRKCVPARFLLFVALPFFVAAPAYYSGPVHVHFID
jgi:hypothetical protein